MRPRVTFVVPCYNLGHLLSECLTSIITQSYTDLEVLVMDDCSPDATPQVAGRIADPRVQHVRNATNLGHLRNYNAGIAMARGEYVWLISADDKLRKPYVVERFVEHLDRHRRPGFAVGERHEDHAVAAERLPVPRSVLPDKDAVAKSRAE